MLSETNFMAEEGESMTKEVKRNVMQMGYGIAVAGCLLCLILFLFHDSYVYVISGVAMGSLAAWICFFLLGVAVSHPEKRICWMVLYALRFGIAAAVIVVAFVYRFADPVGTTLPFLFPGWIILCRGGRGTRNV